LMIFRKQHMSKMNTTSTLLSVSLWCLCAVVLAGCGPRSGGAAPKPSTTILVKGVIARPQALENVVRSSGTVLASESVELVAEAAGRIELLSIREGAHVRRNDLLVTINDDDLQAQLKKIELQITLTSEQEARQKHLYDISGISKEDYDIALNQLNSYKADRDNLLASIRKREIRAPFDGVIGLRYVSEGSYVTPTTRIASVQKLNPLKVDFAIPEKYAGQVGVGDPVEFRSDEARLKFTGKVFAIEPQIDAATRTLQLRAMCDNRSESVFPGAYVQIELQLKRIPNALLIPTQAVVPVLKGQTVYVRKNGAAVSVPVTTGIRTASSVQILTGIAAGDTVITTGLMQMRPGLPVDVAIQENPPAGS
jgi:membrane fusion protein (multidrug efflux system)